MDVIIRKVVIFKAREANGGPDPYEEKFSEAGYHPIVTPPIDFNFCNQEPCIKKLNNPDLYSGIIFTSPRAVEAVSSCLSKDSIHPNWNSLPVFAVGERTSQCVFNHFGLRCVGKESGSAKELATLITERNFDKPLLFPCGNLKTEVLPCLLKEKGIFVEEVTVYRTCQHPWLESNVQEVIKQGLPEYIIFFSPSGVKYTIPLLKMHLVPMEKIKVVCIGPSTAAALREYEIPIWASAEKPNPTSLLDAVLTAKE